MTDDNTELPDDVEAFANSGGPNREEMVSEYLPEKEDWDAKTQLDITDPQNVALLRVYESVMPEMAHMQDTLDEYADHFTKAQTSVAGDSRNDFRKIMMAMFGASEEETSAASMFAKAVGAAAEDEE